ncbi:septum formation protein Maf [Vibrio sp. UCD-FRSSP16_10]|uniref:Maf family protein n=1 Tax=unclassified Vibrio TaxID=2614977 RepID=UPI0007FDAC56|nr:MULTISPECIES: nucleoside triphosphate pyrophosphatase [unclassified Vibrio]OBT08524.1 septum formation protein Maf [Vibrio sp. UCD-FRSSP16_30]OBT18054.1 septum formation protein Maf [Vibrio sp. UCD-FRSSP16_10]
MSEYHIVLASTSPYRAEILHKLSLSFTQVSPNFDETILDNETPEQLVARLAEGKAKACPLPQGQHLVIGSDQVCVVNNQIVGKPHNREGAIQQLTAQSGQTITFYTGLALYNTKQQRTQVSIDTYKVHFKTLSDSQIQNYVDKEQPFHCAGSFKSEGLGIALFRSLEGKDPNTLIGLPLIDLIELLENEGVSVI